MALTLVCVVAVVFLVSFLFFLMIRRPPRSTRTDTLFPYTTLFRSEVGQLVQQCIVQPRHAAGGAGNLADLVADTLAPLARIGQHVAGVHLVHTAGRIGQMQRLWVHETMAGRLATAGPTNRKSEASGKRSLICVDFIGSHHTTK